MDVRKTTIWSKDRRMASGFSSLREGSTAIPVANCYAHSWVVSRDKAVRKRSNDLIGNPNLHGACSGMFGATKHIAQQKQKRVKTLKEATV